MKSLKIINSIICLVLALCVLTGCTSFSLLKPEESTTKQAFDQEAFDEEFYRTSVAEETEAQTTEAASVTDETAVTQISQESTTVSESSTLSQQDADKTTAPATTGKDTGSTITLPSVTKITTTTKKVVEKKREEKNTKSEYKYGVVKVDTVATYYDVYEDGSKVKTDQKSYSTYDYSGYKATTSELTAEAKANKTKYGSEITAAVNAINAYRKENGASELTYDESLATAAGVRATEMAYSNNNGNGIKKSLGSNRPDGRNYNTILKELDINYTEAIMLIGLNLGSGSAAASAWTSKSGSVITSSEYTKIGVCAAQNPDGDTYWCVVFSN